MSTIKPYGNKVLVEVAVAKAVTEGGIYLPDIVTKEEKAEGVVIAVGSNDICLEPGNKVIFGKYAGDEVTADDKKYRILKESEILAVVK